MKEKKISSKEKASKFLIEPNILIQEMGKLTFKTSFKSPKDFPATCTAMEDIAKAENRDDTAKRNGIDNYLASLEKLFNAFDTFVREYSKGEQSAGWINNYNLSNPCESTIFMLWQIRHVWTHKGGLIDEKCKKDYEKTLKLALSNGSKPIIDLPKKLEVGYKFTIQFDDYFSIRKCIFKYIKNRVTEDDYKILSKRSSFTNFRINECSAMIKYDFGTLIFDLVEAYNCGCEVDSVTGEFKAPSKARYDPARECVILPTGETFRAKLIKR